MLKKVFVLTQFGKPHPWTQQYFENIERLGKYGWYWKIFTPNIYDKVPPNVEVIPMTIEQFDALVEREIGVVPGNFITEEGIPHKPVSDFYVATGVIFEKYLKSYDFWGITNWDVVFGRLDNFLPESMLAGLDIFTDDVKQVNGVFSLFRNIKEVNNLFWEIPYIKKMLTEHKLFGIDEYYLIKPILKHSQEQGLTYIHPQYYPLHSYDRLIQHWPEPHLEIQDDGSLWEKFKDLYPPVGYVNFPKGYIAKEIMYFHFSYTKKWPI